MMMRGMELSSHAPLRRRRMRLHVALLLSACITGVVFGVTLLCVSTPAWLLLCALLPAACAGLEIGR